MHSQSLRNQSSAFDFNIPLCDPSGDLLCLCRLNSAGTQDCVSGGNSPCRTALYGSLGADLCELHYKLHSGLLCTLSQNKQQHSFSYYTMNQAELIRPMSESTPSLCTPSKKLLMTHLRM